MFETLNLPRGDINLLTPFANKAFVNAVLDDGALATTADGPMSIAPYRSTLPGGWIWFGPVGATLSAISRAVGG